MKNTGQIKKYVIGVLLALAGYFCGRLLMSRLFNNITVNENSARLYADRALKEVLESEGFSRQAESALTEQLVSEFGVEEKIAEDYAEAFYQTGKKTPSIASYAWVWMNCAL